MEKTPQNRAQKRISLGINKRGMHNHRMGTNRVKMLVIGKARFKYFMQKIRLKDGSTKTIEQYLPIN